MCYNLCNYGFQGVTRYFMYLRNDNELLNTCLNQNNLSFDAKKKGLVRKLGSKKG